MRFNVARPSRLAALPVGLILTSVPLLEAQGDPELAAKLVVAESVIAREEAASERAFDPAFREWATNALAGQPVAVELQEGGLGLNSLGDSQADLVYTPVVPCRIIDTRLAGGILAVGTPRSFLVTGTDLSTQGGSATGCGVPFGPATAAVINFVAVNAGGAGNLRVTPFGTAIPLASIINYTAGLTIANGPAVAMCNPSATTCSGDITVRADVSETHLVADVQGYFRRVSTGGVGTALLADGAVTAPKIGSGVVVRSLNGQTDTVTLAGTNGLGVTQGSGTLTVASNATSVNTAGAIVSRNASGNFSAGTITANLNGNATSASGFSGSLAGEVTGTQAATVVSNAVSTNTANAVVRRDSSGSFSAGTLALGGNLVLPNTTASGGMITLGGNRFLHNFGSPTAANSFVGTGAGNTSMTGAWNTAVGGYALFANTTGRTNTAMGNYALNANTTGFDNTATGSAALIANTTGSQNTATGVSALYTNTSGSQNTATGRSALFANTTGSGNTAAGLDALAANTVGGSNTATGSYALTHNTTGSGNTATGSQALNQNETGIDNTAVGNWALYANTTGSTNTALGTWALGAVNTTGSGNIAIGYQAGFNNTIGNNNIWIGNPGSSSAVESGVIRIGSGGTHAALFLAGVHGTTVANGIPVLINGNAQLGTQVSSARFKYGIASMEEESEVLLKLRPVAFYYRPELDADHVRQYGLVAEEVADVAPQLVAYDENGAPQAVRYHFVNAMLLNEVQKQRRLIEVERRANEEQKATVVRQDLKIHDLEARLARLEAALGLMEHGVY